jgi:hypothetical protein
LWKQLAEFIIKYQPQYSQVTSNCAYCSWKLSGKVSSDVPLLAAAGAVASSNRLITVSPWSEVIMRAAQKALHAIPFDVGSWALTAAATLARYIGTQSQLQQQQQQQDQLAIKYQSTVAKLAQILLAKVEEDHKNVHVNSSSSCSVPACKEFERQKSLSIQCWASKHQTAGLLYTGHIQQAASFCHQVLLVDVNQSTAYMCTYILCSHMSHIIIVIILYTQVLCIGWLNSMHNLVLLSVQSGSISQHEMLGRQMGGFISKIY